jgi:hypothetical protein
MELLSYPHLLADEEAKVRTFLASVEVCELPQGTMAAGFYGEARPC